MVKTKVQDLIQFKNLVNKRFGQENIRTVDSDLAFSVFLDTSETVNKTVIVGRYDKATQTGSIFDRRKNHEQINNTLSNLLRETPRRRKTDKREDSTSDQRWKNRPLQIL